MHNRVKALFSDSFAPCENRGFPTGTKLNFTKEKTHINLTPCREKAILQ